MRINDDIIIEESCGNIFADLDYPNAEEALLKSRLAQRIAEIIEKQNLTQVQAAAILGVDKPKIPEIMRGKLRGFSNEELFRFLTALDQDIEIVIRNKPESRTKATLRVMLY